MTADQFISILAAITLIEMMFTTGLGVRFREVLRVYKNWHLITCAGVANYVFVPCAAIGGVLLPLVADGTASQIDVSRMVITLLGAQLLPLCLGLWVSDQRPEVALICQRPTARLSLALNLTLLTSILTSQFRFVAQIHAKGYLGMLLLLIAFMAAGWVLSGGEDESLKAMVLTTAVRNVAVALVVVTACFPGTAAVTSATAYGTFQTVAMAVVALFWGRVIPATELVRKKAA